MKGTSLIGYMSVACLLCSCSQAIEDKARDLIEAHLESETTKWESYRFVEMTKLDSTYTSFFSTAEGRGYKLRKDSLHRLQQAYREALKVAEERGEASRRTLLADSIDILNRQQLKLEGEMLSAEQRYEGEFNGYRTRYRYQIHNEHDVPVLENRWYFFDKDMTKITTSFR